MRKITLTLFVTTLAIGFIQAQTYFAEDFSSSNWEKTVNDSNLCIPDSLPTGWITIDSMELNQYWHWSVQGPRGAYTSINSFDCFTPNNSILSQMSGTWQNGFMMLESDYFNTLEGCIPKTSNNLITSAIQFGPIDLSQSAAPQMRFNAFGQFCCNGGELAVMVSVNYDAQNPQLAKWHNLDIPVSTDDYLNQNILVNLGQFASNQSNVHIKVVNRNFSHYFFIIDDIQISEAPDYNLSITDYQIEYGKTYEPQSNWSEWETQFMFEGGYTQIPLPLSSKFLNAKARVQNLGSKAQNAALSVTIYQSEEPTYTASGSGVEVSFLERETLELSTNFSPQNEGFYQISATVNSLPNQNHYFGYEFEVTQSAYSRVNASNSKKFKNISPSDYAIGGNDGDMLARHFMVPEDVDGQFAKSLSFYLTSYTNFNMIPSRTAIRENRFNVIGHLFKASEGKDWLPGELVASSELYTIRESDLNSWITLPFFDEGNLLLEPGVYFVALETSTGNVRFELGADPTAPKQPFNGGQFFSQSQVKWYNAEANYAINLNIGSYNSVALSDQAVLAVYPNPCQNNFHLSTTDLIKQIEIIGLDGKTMLKMEPESSQIEVAFLSNGVYLVKVSFTNGHVKCLKIAKQ